MRVLAIALLSATVLLAETTRERLYQVDRVTIQRAGSTITVTVEGHATTGGWKDVRLTRVSKSRNELVYELTGVPPSGMVMQMLTPARATAVFKGALPRRVRVRATDNSKVVAVPPLESR